MTILHVVESFGGGVIGFVNQLTRNLPQHKHVVIHAIREGEVDYELTRSRFPKGVEFVVWPHARREINPIDDYKALRSLQKLMGQYPAAAIHLHSSKAGFLGRAAAWLSNRRRPVYTPNGAAFLRQDISGLQRWLYGRLEKLGSLFGGIVVSCSQSECLAFQERGVRSRIVPNGTEIRHAQRPMRSSSFPIQVVYSGRTTAQKNPALFNAIAKAFTGDERIKFTWIGTGEMDDALTSPNVELTGWKQAPEVMAILESAHLYMSPSMWEGLSLAALEAMETGLPLLMNACPGNTDLVEEGYNGYTFKTTEEAVRQLNHWLANPEELEVMGNYSFMLTRQEYDLAKVAAAYNSLYEQCVSGLS